MNYEARDGFLASLETILMNYPKEYLATAVAGAIAAKEAEKSGFIHGFFNILREWSAADKAAGVYPEEMS